MSYEVIRVHTIRPIPKGPSPTFKPWESEVYVDTCPDIQSALDLALEVASKPLYRALGDRVRVEVRSGSEVVSIF